MPDHMRPPAHAGVARSRGPALAALALAWLLAACASTAVPTGSPSSSPSVPSPPAATAPLSTWPVPPEVLPTAATSAPDARLTCGGRSFPRSGLDASTGAQNVSGPAFDALRAALVEFGQAFPGASGWSWRLAGQDDTGAIFLARTDALGPPGWVSIEMTAGPGGWQPTDMGQCAPFVVLSPDFRPASWALDPASPAPTAVTTELHILVWERTCSDGAPATGRISAPVVVYTAATVTITIGVRPLVIPAGEALTCPLPPGTPAVLDLPEPIGQRTLLDGGQVPPVAPSPANG